jgi:hypothetical protein
MAKTSAKSQRRQFEKDGLGNEAGREGGKPQQFWGGIGGFVNGHKQKRRRKEANEMKGILKALWPGCDYKGKFGGINAN